MLAPGPAPNADCVLCCGAELKAPKLPPDGGGGNEKPLFVGGGREKELFVPVLGRLTFRFDIEFAMEFRDWFEFDVEAQGFGAAVEGVLQFIEGWDGCV